LQCWRLLLWRFDRKIYRSQQQQDANSEDNDDSAQAQTVLSVECTATHTLKGVSRILCSSTDGTILFGGLDELIVYKYLPGSSSSHAQTSLHGISVSGGSIVACEVFPLQLSSKHTSLYSSTAANQHRRTRHLRQIESITCTPDGGYALITCSDNAVFLYRFVRNKFFRVSLTLKMWWFVCVFICSACNVFGIGTKTTTYGSFALPEFDASSTATIALDRKSGSSRHSSRDGEQLPIQSQQSQQSQENDDNDNSNSSFSSPVRSTTSSHTNGNGMNIIDNNNSNANANANAEQLCMAPIAEGKQRLRVKHTTSSRRAQTTASASNLFGLVNQQAVAATVTSKSSKQAPSSVSNNTGKATGVTVANKYVGGYLTLLFQAKEELSLHVNLCYCDNTSSADTQTSAEGGVMCSCCNHMQTHTTGTATATATAAPGICALNASRKFHRHPSEVLLSVCWWLVQAPSKGGVLRVCRLTDTNENVLSLRDATTSNKQIRYYDLIPIEICLPGVGLYSDYDGGSASGGQKHAGTHTSAPPSSRRTRTVCLAANLRYKALQLMQTHLHHNSTNSLTSVGTNGSSNNGEIDDGELLYSSHLSSWIGSPSHFDDIFFANTLASTSSSGSGTSNNKCWVCGDRQVCHWKQTTNSKASLSSLAKRPLAHDQQTHSRSSINRQNSNNNDDNDMDSDASSTHGMTKHTAAGVISKSTALLAPTKPKVPPSEHIKNKKQKPNTQSNTTTTANATSNSTSSSNGNRRDLDSFEKSFGVANVANMESDVDSALPPNHHNNIGIVNRVKRRLTAPSNNSGTTVGGNRMKNLNDGDESADEQDAVDTNANGARSSSGNSLLANELNDRISQLEMELTNAKAETEVILRKADRRFQEEKRMRIAFNVDRNNWDSERQDLLKQLHGSKQSSQESQDMLKNIAKKQVEARRSMSQLFDAVNPLMESMIVGTSDNTNGTNTSSSSSSSAASNEAILSVLGLGDEHIAAVSKFTSPVRAGGANGSTNDPANSIKPPFCVACQSYTADVCLVPCGHICLCYDHVCTMQSMGQLTFCPLCKSAVEAVCRVNGLVAANT
jgi:hypothetical protein